MYSMGQVVIVKYVGFGWWPAKVDVSGGSSLSPFHMYNTKGVKCFKQISKITQSGGNT